MRGAPDTCPHTVSVLDRTTQDQQALGTVGVTVLPPPPPTPHWPYRGEGGQVQFATNVKLEGEKNREALPSDLRSEASLLPMI